MIVGYFDRTVLIRNLLDQDIRYTFKFLTEKVPLLL